MFVPIVTRSRDLRAEGVMVPRAKSQPSDNPDPGKAQGEPLTLAPLSFEEALTGLLQVAPPTKDDAPETAPESPPAKQPRKRKMKQDKECGSR